MAIKQIQKIDIATSNTLQNKAKKTKQIATLLCQITKQFMVRN